MKIAWFSELAVLFIDLLQDNAVDLDFRPDSLIRLEDYIEECLIQFFHAFEDPRDIEELGAFLGEMIIQNIGGHWNADEKHEVNDVPGIGSINPFQVAQNRMSRGGSLVRWFNGLRPDQPPAIHVSERIRTPEFFRAIAASEIRAREILKRLRARPRSEQATLFELALADPGRATKLDPWLSRIAGALNHADDQSLARIFLQLLGEVGPLRSECLLKLLSEMPEAALPVFSQELGRD